MDWTGNPYIIWLILAGVVSGTLFVLLMFRRKQPGAMFLAFSMLAEVIWTLAWAVEASVVPLPEKIFWTKVGCLGVYNLVPLYLFFTIVFVGKKAWLKPRFIIPIWSLSWILILLAITNDYHHLIWGGFVPAPHPMKNMYYYLHGPLYGLGVAINYLETLFFSFLLIRYTFSTRYSIYRWQAVFAAASIVPPVLANISFVFSWGPLNGYDLTPLAFSLSGVIIFIGVFRFRFLDLSPMARDVLFEHIHDSIVVLDCDNQIVDINAAAKMMLSGNEKELIGHKAEQILLKFPGLIEKLPSQVEFKLTEKTPGSNPRYYEITASPLLSSAGDPRGQLLLFRDVTVGKLYEETEHKQRLVAEAQRDVILDITSTLDFDEVLDRILDKVILLIPCDMANICMVDENGYACIARYRGSLPAELMDQLDGMKFEVAETDNLRRMTETGQPMFIADTYKAEKWKIKNPYVRSYVGAPIQIKGETVGFLNADNEQPDFYNAEYASRMQSFADLAAIAIKNARMFKMVNEMAITDGLTGLFNHRHLFGLAENEVNRSLRYGSPLSVLMMDMDKFKEVNDQYGHQTGDQVLNAVARLIQLELRNIDIAGRYGGDEFCIILPETGESDAENVAERLLNKIPRLNIQTKDGVPLHLCASIGVSSLAVGITTFDELLNLADQALYQAKEKGRNRVEVTSRVVSRH